MKKYTLIIFILLIFNDLIAQKDSLNNGDTLSLEALLTMEFSSDDMQKHLDVKKVISGSKDIETLKYSPGLISVIDHDDIRKFGGNSLWEILQRAVGVFMPNSYIFRQNVIGIRGDVQGHFNTHTLILLDGRPMRESLYGGIDMAILNSFPIETVERIEVTRGPGSVLYGTGAFAGIINIITKKNLNSSVCSDFKVGSFGTLGQNTSFSFQKDDVNISGSTHYFKQDGWTFSAFDEGIRRNDTIGLIFSQNPVYQEVNYGQENLGAHLNLSYKNWTLRTFYGKSYMDILGFPPLWKPDVHGTGGSETIDNVRLFTDLGYKHEFSDKIYSTFNLTYNRLQITEFGSSGMPGEARADDWLFEITNFYKPSDTWYIILGGLIKEVQGEGLTYSPTSFEASFYAKPYDEFQYAAYSQVEYSPIDFIKFIGGVQLNKIPTIDIDLVPRIGLIFNIKQGLGAKILYGQAFKNPTGVEAFFELPGAVGNPNLAPEKVTTFDAQLSYQRTYYQASISYFKSRQSDLITRETIGSVTQFINEGEFFIEGGEFELEVIPITNLHLNFSGSYQENYRDEESNDLNVNRIPQTMLKGGVSYYFKGIDIGIFNAHYSALSVFKNATTHQLNSEPKAYNLLSMNLNLHLKKLFYAKSDAPEVWFSIYGENLLDETFHEPERVRKTINTLPARSGRAIFGSLKFNF